MKATYLPPIMVLAGLLLLLSGCQGLTAEPASSPPPAHTSTATLVPTAAPSQTPLPTKTPIPNAL